MTRRRRPKIVILDTPEKKAAGQARAAKRETNKKPPAKKEVSIRKKPRGKSKGREKTVENASEKTSEATARKSTTRKRTVPKGKRSGQANSSGSGREIKRKTIGRGRKKVEPAPPPPSRRPNLILTIVFGGILLLVLAAFIFIPLDSRQQAAAEAAAPPTDNCLGIHPDLSEWGLDLKELSCDGGYWSDNQDFAEWLLDRNVSYRDVIILQDRIADKGYPPIAPGNPYTVLHRGNAYEPQVVAYQPNPSAYVLLKTAAGSDVMYHRVNVLAANNIRQEVYVQTDLADAMFNRQFGLKLTEQMEKALKWKVDMFHLDPGDNFNLLFEQFEYESGFTDVGNLLAIRSTVNGQASYAFYFDDGREAGYFDDEGYPMKSGFLKAPLTYYRISSAYNLQRADPFNGRVHPHLGTDYAAPAGTPILAVADGVITHAEFKGNNGNYVKITHNEHIKTQYLHLQDFAEGIFPGREVRQGDVIGYVGMTGRATGPHVCFRFWKDGQQVDHRQESDYRVAPRLEGQVLEEFYLHRDSLWQQLDPL